MKRFSFFIVLLHSFFLLLMAELPVFAQVLAPADTAQSINNMIIGYGTKNRNDLTGAVSAVQRREVKDRVNPDAANAIDGKMAGVRVLTDSGAPGAFSSILVRGYQRDNDNAAPLYLVDGLPVNDIQFLDPEMIESVEILKDAAYASIYGVRGRNGVVVITTRKGAGRVQVFYDNRVSLSFLDRRPDLMNASEYIQSGKSEGWLTDEMLSAAGYNGLDTDWVGEAFGPAWGQHHTFGVQGGNGKGQFFAAFNHTGQDGIFKGDKDNYKRLSGQFNAGLRLADWLNVNLNASIDRWDRRYISEGTEYGSAMRDILAASPLFPVKTDKDGLTPDMKEHLAAGDHIVEADEPGMYWAMPSIGVPFECNPFIRRDVNVNTSSGNAVNGILAVDVRVMKDLTLTSRFGYRSSSTTWKESVIPYYANYRNTSAGYPGVDKKESSSFWLGEVFADYSRRFGQHKVDAMAGVSYEKGDDALMVLGSGGSFSFFGRVSYSYANRYQLMASFRSDSSPATNSPAKVPAFSAGWTISNEPFFGLDVVDLLKLRASWGNYDGHFTTSGTSTFAIENGNQMDLGLDMRMLNNRLLLTVDYFEKNRESLFAAAVVATADVTHPAEKGPSVRNLGAELELSWEDVVGDFSYSLRGNLTWLKNEVTYLEPSIAYYSVAGPTGSNLRLYYEQGYPVWYIGKNLDYSGREMVGSSIPDFVYGLTFNMAYMGFDFELSGSGLQGNEAVSFLRRPDMPYTNTYRNCEDVFDASYFKIRRLQFGYNLPGGLLRKVFIKRIRIYASLDNILTFTSYPGFDPETASAGRVLRSDTSSLNPFALNYNVWPTGLDCGAYPVAKSVSLGLNMAF